MKTCTNCGEEIDWYFGPWHKALGGTTVWWFHLETGAHCCVNSTFTATP